MAQTFNIVAQLQLQGAANSRAIAQQLQRQIQGINATVNIQFNSAVNRSLLTAQQRLQGIVQALQQITQAAGPAQNALANVATPLNQIATNFNRVNASARATTQTITQTSRQLEVATTNAARFGEQAALAVRRFAAFSIPAGLLVGFVTSVKHGVEQAVEFERELVRVAQVTGKTLAGLAPLSDEITRLSTGLGVASEDLIKVSTVLAQAGLSATDTKVALDALAKSALAPNFKDIQNTTEGVIALMGQFNVTADQVSGKLGEINAVAGAFAVEAEDLVSAIRRTGGAFKEAGGSMEELIALFTSVRATTRESAESIATGFRTIFTRIQRPATIEYLRQAGVELQNLEGNFVGPYEAVRRLSAALKGLEGTDPRFQQIIEELGGFRQVSKVIPLIQQFSQAERALAVAMTGQDSLNKDAATAQQALAVQTARVREEFLNLFREIEKSSSFQAFAKTALEVASALIQTASAVKPLLPLLAGLAAIQGLRFGGQFLTGFSSGLFKVGGRAAGEGLAGVVTGQSAVNATAGTQAVGQTSALASNTTAILGLTNALRVFGTARFPGIRFASGGVVPGHGHGDIVPAMLAPGEFVMRKPAVDRYGVSNLAKMNSGGYVRHYEDGSDGGVQGGLNAGELRRRKSLGTLLAASGAKNRDDYSALVKEKAALDQRFKSSGKAPEDIYNLPGNWGVGFFTPGGYKGQPVPISTTVGNLSSTAKEKLASLVGAPQGVLNATVQATPHLFSLSESAKQIFEGEVIDPLGKNITSAVAKSLGGASDVLGLPTNHIQELVSHSGYKSLIGNLYEGFVRTAVLKSPKVADVSKDPLFDIPSVDLAQHFRTIFGANISSGIPLELKAYDEFLAKQKGEVISKFILAKNPKPQKLAEGGSVDTVPAMLTPGEFVFNKQAVNRIGVGNLNAMNKGVAHFAAGGFVGNALGSNQGLLALTVGLSTLANTASIMFKFNEATSRTIAQMTQLASTFIVLRTAVGEVRSAITSRINPKASIPGFQYDQAAIDRVGKAAANQVVNAQVPGYAQRVSSGAVVLNRQRIQEAQQEAARQHLAAAGSPLANGPIDVAAIARDRSIPIAKRRALLNAARLGGTAEEALQQASTTRSYAEGNPLLDRTLSRDTARAATDARNSAVQQERLRQRQAALDARNTRFANVAGVAGTLAIAGGGFISDIGQRQASKAQTVSELNSGIAVNKTGSILAGAGTGAIAGATIGSFVPVIGTAIGAVVGAIGGGLVGAINDGSEELRKAFENAQFEKTVDSFRKAATQALGPGEFRAGSAVGAANSLQDLINKGTAATDAEQKKSFQQQALNELPTVKALIDRIAAQANSVDDFNKSFGGVGKRLVEQYAFLTGQTLPEVREQLDNQIKITAKLNEAQERYRQAISSLDTLSRAVRRIGGAIESAADKFAGLDSEVSGIIADAKGESGGRVLTGPPGVLNGIFGRAAAGTLANPGALTPAVQAITGDKTTLKAAQDLEKVQRLLPDALLGIANSARASNDKLELEFNKLFDQNGILGDIGPLVKQTLFESFRREVTERGKGGEVNVAKQIRENPSEFAQKIFGDKETSLFKAFEEVVKTVLDTEKQVKAIGQQRVKFELEIAENNARLAAQSFEELKVVKSLKPRAIDRDTTLAEVQAFRTREQQAFTGRNIANPFSVAEISKRLADLTARRGQLEAQQNQGDNFLRSSEITKDINDLNAEIVKLQRGLQNLGDSTKAVSLLQDVLARKENERQAKFATVSSRVTFGNAQEQQSFVRDVTAALLVARSPLSVQDFGDETKKGLLAFLTEMKDVALPAIFGEGRKGSDVFKDVVRVDTVEKLTPLLTQFGVTQKGLKPEVAATEAKKQAEDIAEQLVNRTSDEQKIIKAIEDSIKVAEEARNTLKEKLDIGLEQLTKQITDAIKESSKTITQATSRAAQIPPLELEKNRLQLAKESISGQAEAGKDLRGLIVGNKLGGEDFIGAAQNISRNQSDIREFQKISSNIAELSKYSKLLTTDYRTETTVSSSSIGGSISQSTRKVEFVIPKGEIRQMFQEAGANLTGLTGNYFNDSNIKVFEEKLFTELKNRSGGQLNETELRSLVAEATGSVVQSRSPGDVGGALTAAVQKRLLEKGSQEDTLKIVQDRLKAAGLSNAEAFVKNPKLFDQILSDLNKLREIDTTAKFNELIVNLGNLETALGHAAENIRKVNEAIDKGKPIPTTVDTSGVSATGVKPGKSALGGFISSSFGMAAGGLSSGTDTRLAVLTPGEYVVNASATAKHRGLLEHINGGAQYLAEGGQVSAFAFRRRPGAGQPSDLEPKNYLSPTTGKPVTFKVWRAEMVALRDNLPPVKSKADELRQADERSGGPQLRSTPQYKAYLAKQNTKFEKDFKKKYGISYAEYRAKKDAEAAAEKKYYDERTAAIQATPTSPTDYEAQRIASEHPEATLNRYGFRGYFPARTVGGGYRNAVEDAKKAEEKYKQSLLPAKTKQARIKDLLTKSGGFNNKLSEDEREEKAAIYRQRTEAFQRWSKHLSALPGDEQWFDLFAKERGQQPGVTDFRSKEEQDRVKKYADFLDAYHAQHPDQPYYAMSQKEFEQQDFDARVEAARLKAGLGPAPNKKQPAAAPAPINKPAPNAAQAAANAARQEKFEQRRTARIRDARVRLAASGNLRAKALLEAEQNAEENKKRKANFQSQMEQIRLGYEAGALEFPLDREVTPQDIENENDRSGRAFLPIPVGPELLEQDPEVIRKRLAQEDAAKRKKERTERQNLRRAGQELYKAQKEARRIDYVYGKAERRKAYVDSKSTSNDYFEGQKQILKDAAALREANKRRKDELDAKINGDLPFVPPGIVRRQSGGAIPGVGSGDHVPALLEPGEFVLNKRAAAAAGLHNLSNFNSRFATGGSVGGGGTGGALGFSTDAIAALTNFNSQFAQNIGFFTQSIKDVFSQINFDVLRTAMENFGAKTTELISGLSAIPSEVTHTIAPVRVEVDLQGAAFLSGLDDILRSKIENAVQTALRVQKAELRDGRSPGELS